MVTEGGKRVENTAAARRAQRNTYGFLVLVLASSQLLLKLCNLLAKHGGIVDVYGRAG